MNDNVLEVISKIQLVYLINNLVNNIFYNII